MIKYRKIRLVH